MTTWNTWMMAEVILNQTEESSLTYASIVVEGERFTGVLVPIPTDTTQEEIQRTLLAHQAALRTAGIGTPRRPRAKFRTTRGRRQ